MHPDNLESGKYFGLRHRFKVCTVTRYLGVFIGDDESKHDWLKYWKKNIFAITKTVGKHPQESYAVVVCVIQSEWIFLQHVTKETGYAFAGSEKLLRGKKSSSLL